MKILIFTFFMILLAGCRSGKIMSENQPVTEQSEEAVRHLEFHDPATWLLGYFPRDRMTAPPHSGWFFAEYEKYKFDESTVKKLTMTDRSNLTIKIVIGTWCPDSRREVPRFMKILDSLKYPAEKVTFIGVDDSKISPVGEYNSLDIQRVPTFIFYRNNIEAGRIIEVPLTSLEQDMLNILSKE